MTPFMVDSITAAQWDRSGVNGNTKVEFLCKEMESSAIHVKAMAVAHSLHGWDNLQLWRIWKQGKFNKTTNNSTKIMFFFIIFQCEER